MLVSQSNLLIKRLDMNGWQSLSTTNNGKVKLPHFNFRPSDKKDKYIFPISPRKNIKKSAYGWCSWYAYGREINQENILSNAIWISQNKTLPLEYVLIDDGWTLYGDWTKEDNNKFPDGIKNIAKKIKRLGLKPGIWFGPFLVDPKSETALKHPDWLVKHNGKFVDGINLTPWDRVLPYKKWILDIKKPEAVKYIKNSINYLLEECGFNLLKLDFLYSIHFDPNLTGIEADEFLRDFLIKIKEKYPHVYTIASSCPFLPAINVVDSMRIGPDSLFSPYFNFSGVSKVFSDWYLRKKVIPTLQTRSWTRKFWNLDPDAFVCRKSLGLKEQTILEFQNIVKKANGNIFLGDDLTQLSQYEISKYISPLFKVT